MKILFGTIILIGIFCIAVGVTKLIVDDQSVVPEQAVTEKNNELFYGTPDNNPRVLCEFIKNPDNKKLLSKFNANASGDSATIAVKLPTGTAEITCVQGSLEISIRKNFYKIRLIDYDKNGIVNKAYVYTERSVDDYYQRSDELVVSDDNFKLRDKWHLEYERILQMIFTKLNLEWDNAWG